MSDTCTDSDYPTDSSEDENGELLDEKEQGGILSSGRFLKISCLVFAAIASIAAAILAVFMFNRAKEAQDQERPATTHEGIVRQTRADIDREVAAWTKVLNAKKESPTEYTKTMGVRDFADSEKWTYKGSLIEDPLSATLSQAEWTDLERNKGTGELLINRSTRTINVDNDGFLTEADANQFIEDCEKEEGGKPVYFYHGCPIGRTLFDMWKNSSKDAATIRGSDSGRFGPGLYTSSNFYTALKYTIRGNKEDGEEQGDEEHNEGIFRILACLTKTNVLPLGVNLTIGASTESNELIKEGRQFNFTDGAIAKQELEYERPGINGRFEYERHPPSMKFINFEDSLPDTFGAGVDVDYVAPEAWRGKPEKNLASTGFTTDFVNAFLESHSFGGEWIITRPFLVKVQAVIWFSK